MTASRSRSHAAGVGTDLAHRFSEVLATEVIERLARLDRIAAGEPRTPAEVARIRHGLAEAVAAWRRLLDRHRADDHDRCPKCRTWFGLRRVRWPCRVWLTAHEHLVTDPGERAATNPRRRRRTGPSHPGPGPAPPQPRISVTAPTTGKCSGMMTATYRNRQSLDVRLLRRPAEGRPS